MSAFIGPNKGCPLSLIVCGGLLIPVGKLSGLLPPPLWGSEVRVSHSAGGALQLFKGFGCKSSETLAVQTFARFKSYIYVYFLGSVHHRSPKITSRHLPLFCHHGIWVRNCFLFKDKKKKNPIVLGQWQDFDVITVENNVICRFSSLNLKYDHLSAVGGRQTGKWLGFHFPVFMRMSECCIRKAWWECEKIGETKYTICKKGCLC